MHSIAARSQVSPGSPGPFGHSAPRKSASYRTLRRELDKSPSFHSSPDPSSPITPEAALPPPRPPRSKARGKPAHASSPTSPSFDTSFSSNSANATSPKHSKYSFPSVEREETPSRQSESSPMSTPRAYSRTRSRTGPSGRPSNPWADPVIPALRFSGSSTQQSETPPDTPQDTTFSLDFPVLVSAPVSGVEMMDALVDNMNGGDDLLSSTLSRHAFGIPNHHPLYQPPLPTPPPGVVLGGGKPRKSRKTSRSSPSYSGDEDDDVPAATPSRRKRNMRPPSARQTSSSTITPASTSTSRSSSARPALTRGDSMSSLSRPGTSYTVTSSASSDDVRRSMAPSISDIIRAYAPDGQLKSGPPSLSRRSSQTFSQSHSTAHDHEDDVLESYTIEEESDLTARSSIDSIANEVQQTLKKQTAMKPSVTVSAPPSSFVRRHSTPPDSLSIITRSEGGGGGSSIYSGHTGTSINIPASPYADSFVANLTRPHNASQAVAQYLRSTRLTTLLKLTRSPHASADNPLTVSLSDLGSPSGSPVLVFLGLGCVRHIMGLYDEMAECLGLRLITIDRWGLGRTEPRARSAKGIMQWASVVEEILDLLHIERCSVMAHSAGAPYALSFANSFPHRIRGDICLLAPWVGGGESGGYKWLKYIPNGILKTAQAAEWKLQAWMIGKPPTIPFEGIGYTAEGRRSSSLGRVSSSTYLSTIYSSANGQPRPSLASSNFSDYDDLQDFDGRFESRSTLGQSQGVLKAKGTPETKLAIQRKNSRGFLDRLRGSPASQPQSPSMEESSKPQSAGKRLKALRSMSSLRSKHSPKKTEEISPQLPPPLKVDVGLGLDDLSWTKGIDYSSLSPNDDDTCLTATPDKYATISRVSPNGIGHAIRRSCSFNSPGSLPDSPVGSALDQSFTSTNTSLPIKEGSDYQAILGNALIAASHAESAKGTHNDLLQILNHDNHPWGFSYTSYPHRVRVWYGDKDEKIAENAVRWMEKTMGPQKCSVKVVKGADHGLMYKSSVVIEVLETIQTYAPPTAR